MYSADVSAQHQLVLLLATLGVPPLSHSVAADVQYEEMSDWHEMAQRIAEALLMAQRWCWHNKTRQEYDAIAGVSHSYTQYRLFARPSGCSSRVHHQLTCHLNHHACMFAACQVAASAIVQACCIMYTAPGAEC